ncbi:hypothetical protein Tco_0236087 [Tanacetum coccineum]
MAEYSQKWHNGISRSRSTKTPYGLAALQAQLKNLGREIKKVNEKVYAAQVGCEQCKGPNYTKDFPRKEEGKTLKEAYYTQFDAAIRNQGASIKTLEIKIGQMCKVLQERGFGSLPRSTEANPRDQVKSISTTIEADSYLIRQKKGSYGPQFLKSYSEASQSIPQKEKDLGSFTLPCFINNVCFDNSLVDLGASVSVMPLSTYLNLGLDMPEDIIVPLIFEKPFLSTARAKIDVYKRKITLRAGEERIVFTSVKSASSLIKRVYMLSLRERMELDLEARLMYNNLQFSSM